MQAYAMSLTRVPLGGVIAALFGLALTGAPNQARACQLAPFEQALASCQAAGGNALCGQIYSTREKSFLKSDIAECGGNVLAPLQTAIDATLAKSGIVILGEVHDNPVHHQLRADLVGRAGAVAFEQLRADQQGALDKQALEPAPTTLDAFKAATNWAKSGWDQTTYDPLLTAVLRPKLPMYAADVPRSAMMDLVKKGATSISEEERGRLALAAPWSAALMAAALVEIEEAHCGALPKEAHAGMAIAQRYRDAHLADITLKAAEKHGSAILITGNNHARTDRGVPWYLKTRDPKRPVLSVIFTEVSPGKADINDYIPTGPDGTAAADLIVLTAPATRTGDPCDAFQKKPVKTG